MAQGVVIQMVATGTVTAIATAVAKFRKHMHGTAAATVEDDEQDDDLGD